MALQLLRGAVAAGSPEALRTLRQGLEALAQKFATEDPARAERYRAEAEALSGGE